MNWDKIRGHVLNFCHFANDHDHNHLIFLMTKAQDQPSIMLEASHQVAMGLKGKEINSFVSGMMYGIALCSESSHESEAGLRH